MTEQVKTLLRKVATNRIAEIAAEVRELQAALHELGGVPILAAVAANDGHVAAPVSPLSARLDVLRDANGPVFVVTPKVAVAVGQEIVNADGRKVEMLEEANLADDSGEVKPGRWFAKLVEA